MSTTQNSNNRGQAGVTKDGDTISDPGSAVQVITIEDGTKDGTVAFNVGNGYLYAASSGSNYLRTENTLSDNSSWLVTIADGVATIKAQGTNTRNWLRYNSASNNGQLFSCYASGQSDVSIYKRQGTGSAPLPKLAAPTVTADLNNDETGINVSWTAVANATSYVISGIGEDVTVEDATSYSFTELTSGAYTITVTAKAEGYKSAESEAKSVTVPSAESGDEGGASGEEKTITLTLNSNTTGNSSTNYVQTAYTFTYEGVTYSVNNWNPSSLQIRGNQTASNNMQSGSNFMLRNTTAIPGRIKSITITYTAGTIVATKTYAQVGSANITNQTTSASVQGTAGTGAVSWTFDDGGSYFAIGMTKGGTSGTTKAGTITVVYIAN